MTKPLRSILSAIFKNSIGLPKPSRKGLERALQPPHDDTQEVLHDVVDHDPFRPLEKLTAQETLDWVARQNARTDAALSAPVVKEAEKKAIEFFKGAAIHGMRETMPARCGDKYLCTRKEEN